MKHCCYEPTTEMLQFCDKNFPLLDFQKSCLMRLKKNQRNAAMANVPPLARAVLVLMGFNIQNLQSIFLIEAFFV